MELRLVREFLTAKSTTGRLWIDGEWFCWTLEDPVRPPGVKIKGNTAIPAGRYQVIISFSNRFKRPLPLLLKVPMFEGIRIHPGNSAANTEGCLLVGYSRTTDWIYESRRAFEDLFQRITTAANKEKIWISIENPPAVEGSRGRI